MRQLNPLTPGDIRGYELDTHRFKEGYDTEQVDELLDRCADTIEVLSKELLKLNGKATR